MAVSFKKEVIAEAIQEVLAEAAISPAEKAKLKTYSVTATNQQQVKDELRQKGVKDVSNVKPGSSVTAEDHHENPNDDSDMAKSQLYAIAKYAIELLQMIKDGDPLDAWVQAKITKASDYIDAVQHYLEGEEYLDANQEESEEELAESDYQARTKEDLVFQYLRDAWQFGATKGRDVNPDEELSTMADSLLANLPDYDSAEKAEKPKEKSAFEKRLEKLAAAEKERRANLKEGTLDEIKKAEFEKIKPGKELQLRGYGVVKVIENDGIVMKIKDSLDKVHTINLGQYNEKFLKEDDDVEPSKKDIKAAEKDVKNVSDDKKEQFNRALAFIKKFKDNPGAVAGMLKKAKEEYKLPKNLLKDLARAAQVSETLAEGVSCCGRCGRVHESAQDCKKPYISKDSPRHCKNKK